MLSLRRKPGLQAGLLQAVTPLLVEAPARHRAIPVRFRDGQQKGERLPGACRRQAERFAEVTKLRKEKFCTYKLLDSNEVFSFRLVISPILLM